MSTVNYVNKKGNWYKYDCPKGISGIIINFTKDVMKKENMPPKKLRRFNKVYISCKKTESSVFYKILVYGNKNFVCFDMSNNEYSYKWYEVDIGLLDDSDDCSTCGWPNYTRERRTLMCHNGSGIIKSNVQFNTINEECYKYIDSIKKHISVRVIKGPITLANNKATTYLLFKAIRNKEKHKEKKMSQYNEMYIFKRISWLPLEMIRYIIKFM